jgi:hypothetical protein
MNGVKAGVNECEAGHSPPDGGGVDATSRRSREASFNGADGVVGNGTPSIERILKHFGNPNHLLMLRPIGLALRARLRRSRSASAIARSIN